MINSQDIKKGTCIRLDGKLYFCVDFLHVKPGKGNTIMRTTLKDVVKGGINRSQLSREHLDYVIAAVKALYEDRESIPNMRIVAGHSLPMRHFHAFLEPYPNEEK